MTYRALGLSFTYEVPKGHITAFKLLLDDLNVQEVFLCPGFDASEGKHNFMIVYLCSSYLETTKNTVQLQMIGKKAPEISKEWGMVILQFGV